MTRRLHPRTRVPLQRTAMEKAAIAFCVNLNPDCPCERQRTVCAAMMRATGAAALYLVADPEERRRLMREGQN